MTLLRVQLWATNWECKYYLHKSKGRDCHLAWPIYNAWEVKSKGEGKLELIPIRIWVFWVYSFAIQPFKIVLMIPSSCYQIKSPFYRTQYIFSFFVPLTSLQQRHYCGEAYWTQLPWQKSSYLGLPVITKLCIESKLKERSQPPPTPPFNFGYHFNINMSQKNCLLLREEGVGYNRIHKYQNFLSLWSKFFLTIIISTVSIIIDTKDIEEHW